MVRYIVFALLGCLYAAASVLLVQSEGRAYRKASRRTPIAASNTPASSVKPPADHTKTTAAVEIVSTSTEPSPRDKSSGNSSPLPAPAPPAKTHESKISPMPAPVQVADVRPATATSHNQPAGQPLGNVPAPAARLELDELWKRSFVRKPWNLDNRSAKDEMILGEQLSNVILRLNPRDEGSGLLRIEEAAKPLLALRSRKEITYQFTILNSEIANAFSHPGGFIYISRKLLDMVPEDQDEVLEFLIGHEIAHVDMRHAIQCLQAPDVKEFHDGTLWKLYFVIIPHAYPDELEFAADEWVYRKMKQIGRSDYECLRFLRRLESYAKAQGFADGHRNLEGLLKINSGESKAISIISPLDNHLRAHTAPKSRLDQLKLLRERLAKGAK